MKPIGGRHSGLLALALAAALLPLAVSPAPADAAAKPLVLFNLIAYNDYVALSQGPANTNGTLDWRAANGDPKEHYVVMTNATGDWSPHWSGNWEALEPGDTMTATFGQRSRTFRVPRLTANINRITNVVSGLSTPGGLIKLDLGYKRPHWRVAVHPDGTYRYDFTSRYDIAGGDYVVMTWSNSKGDTYQRFANAPGIGVTIGFSDLGLSANDGAPFHVDLWSKSGVLKARYYGHGNDASYEARFMKDGMPVLVEVDDTVDARTLAADARFKVRAISVAGIASTDLVSGTCATHTAYTVAFSSGHTIGWFDGTTDEHGRYTVDVSSGVDLQSGDFVQVSCRQPGGDWVGAVANVP